MPNATSASPPHAAAASDRSPEHVPERAERREHASHDEGARDRHADRDTSQAERERVTSSIGTWRTIAPSASTGSHRARPRTKRSGYTTVAIVDAIIHGTR